MRNRHTEPRTLADVERDLSFVVGRKTRNMLEFGHFLNEGKELVVKQHGHGKWLQWQWRHTRLSPRTAQQYMAAATWADEWNAKCATVAHLLDDQLDDPYAKFENIAPKGLYLLASANYSDDIVKKVLEAAASRPINEDDVKDIAEAGTEAAIIREIEAEERAAQEAEAKEAGFESIEAWQAALKEEEAKAEAKYEAAQARRDAVQAAATARWDAYQAEAEAKRAAEQAAIAAILDGGPDPSLPPPAEPVAAPESHVSTFDKAVEMLRSVMTKSLDAFAAATASTDTTDQIASFLLAYGERRRQHQ
jgi:hypothetical protein